ncbi:MAG TPA: tyrosine-type recombinase/integrase [Planctomycetota bacterium]|jgi:integrase
MPAIVPRPFPNRRGYRAVFRHPLLKKKVVARGLGTEDENKAKAVCRDLSVLCGDEKYATALDKRSRELLGFEREALVIYYGKDRSAEIDNILHAGRKALADPDVTDILAAIEESTALAQVDKHETGVTWSEDDLASHFAQFLREFSPRRFKEMQDEIQGLKTKVKVLEPENDELKAENARLRRQQNLHVKISVQSAYEEWKKEYRGRAKITVAQATHAIDQFLKTLNKAGATPLGAIRPREVDAWVNGMKLENGADANPVTKKKNKAYLSTFLTWAFRRYDLVENPMDKAAPVPGYAHRAEKIIAIDRLEDIDTLLDGLKRRPYWQAWVAVAILAGPRWSEQVHLQLDDVHLDDNYIRIVNRSTHITKTGRERRVPIEQTKLKNILATYVERHRPTGTNWLFPSLAPEGKRPRTSSPQGVWVNCIFRNYWKDISRSAGKNKNVKSQPPTFWQYGPREWRHTFGTVLGMCGWNSLEIARVMGNNPAIADRHYIAATSAGKRWPFKW